MKAIPAINFRVDGAMYRLIVEPNRTAKRVDTTRALEAAAKTRRGRTLLSVAYSIVAS